MSEIPLFVSDPEQWIAELNGTNDQAIVCIVIFRGSWCEYDAHYLEKLATDDLPPNAYLVAWTSEGQAGADKAQLFLVKLALLNANALGDETLFQQQITAALQDL